VRHRRRFGRGIARTTRHTDVFGPNAAVFSQSVVLFALFLAVALFTEFFACEDLTQNLKNLPPTH
jgi:hypothetical protein